MKHTASQQPKIPLYDLCLKAAGKETGDEIRRRLKEEERASKPERDAKKKAISRQKWMDRNGIREKSEDELLAEKWMDALMYKSTSRSQQRGVRLQLADLATGMFEELEPEQQRENLVARYKKLTKECAALPKGQAKKDMGLEIADVARRISEIRPKQKPRDLANYFMDVAREEMTKAQFDRWVNEAQRRHDAAVTGAA